LRAGGATARIAVTRKPSGALTRAEPMTLLTTTLMPLAS